VTDPPIRKVVNATWPSMDSAYRTLTLECGHCQPYRAGAALPRERRCLKCQEEEAQCG
jgi:hypothetical protein